MAVINVPKPPKRAFNKNRPASSLLHAQIEHLEAAAGVYPAPKRRKRKPRTEGQAAAYIQELTRKLLPQADTAAKTGTGVGEQPPDSRPRKPRGKAARRRKAR